jgi:flavodoxin/NAD-dependent dihydropyrimidine dehydrogenase PreA subunit
MVKTRIIIFSQTGNTRRVAEEIRTGILSETGVCELVELRDVDPASLKSDDLVGLGCPVFYCQEPLNVRDFIAALPQMPDRKWFVFCTHGAIMGVTLQSMAEALQRKGIDVIGYHDTYASATLPFYPYPMLTAGHPDTTDLEEARIFGRLTIRRLRRLETDKPPPSATPPSVPNEWCQNAAQFTPESFRRIFPALSINESRCSRCYDCQVNCPVAGIDIDHVPPQIQKPCIFCWRCVNSCPQAAIEADWRRQVRAAPKLLNRYRYWLNVAVTQGKFRWHIDPDDIDYDNPLYRQRRQAAGD